MASPLPVKKTVDLSAPVVRVSRIRRDPPPPPERKLTRYEQRLREARLMTVGIILFGLALFVITLGVTQITGWSPRQWVVHIGE